MEGRAHNKYPLTTQNLVDASVDADGHRNGFEYGNMADELYEIVGMSLTGEALTTFLWRP